MPVRYDLHSHSDCSDGSLSPGALVDFARARGITHLALTDHDTTAGLDAALDAAGSGGPTVIPGVEISTTWERRTIHIVGLGINATNHRLRRGLEQQQALRSDRTDRILTSLANMGMDIGSELRTCVVGGLVTRTHVARALINAGHATSIHQAFSKWLGPGKPGYVSTRWPVMAESVRWIHDAGGLAVLAHPMRYGLGRRPVEDLFSAFKHSGGDGVEVVSGSLDRNKIQLCGRLAEKFQLRGSVGSDFHGPDQAWLRLGRSDELPDMVDPVWRTDWD